MYAEALGGRVADNPWPGWGMNTLAIRRDEVLRSVQDARGFPFLAMWAEWGGGCDQRGRIDLAPDATVGIERALPLRPIWRGLVGDAAVYAGVWGAMLFGPGAARRWWRRRGGRCVSCGYALEGLAEGSVCPECGARRRASLAADSYGDDVWREGAASLRARLR